MKVAIPRTIQVGGVDYKVTWDEATQEKLANEGNNGQCNKQELSIKFNPRQARVTQTFVHELTHAIDFEYCHANLTEQDVNGMATGFLQALRQLGVELVLEE